MPRASVGEKFSIVYRIISRSNAITEVDIVANINEEIVSIDLPPPIRLEQGESKDITITGKLLKMPNKQDYLPNTGDMGDCIRIDIEFTYGGNKSFPFPIILEIEKNVVKNNVIVGAVGGCILVAAVVGGYLFKKRRAKD